MNQNQLITQMLDFNRTTFENTFNTLTMLQEQVERVANGCLEQATWLPKAGKTVIDEWTNACKKGRESFKSSMDEGFKKVEAFFADFPKGQ
ncbi:MAG: hypothetical protein NTY36_00965 [Deltaproteobacteria bacterium]|nr:hypothetical protein [Deltaproteobacteria bacterium]